MLALHHRGLRKLALNSRQPGGARKMRKNSQKPFTAAITHAESGTVCTVRTRPLLRTGTSCKSAIRAPAQQGHRPPCRKTARQRQCQQPCPRTWTNPSDDLHNRVIDHQEQQLRGQQRARQAALVQELHGPHSERRRPISRTIREPTLELPGAALDRRDNDRRIALYRALGSAGAWVHSPEGGDTGRMSPPRECRPSSDSSRCTCRPLSQLLASRVGT